MGRIGLRQLGDGRYDIVVEGEDHTLGNLLAERLSRKPGVKTAYYTNPHPLEDKIIIHLTLEEGDPIALLEEALDEIMSEARSFAEDYKKTLQEKGIYLEEE